MTRGAEGEGGRKRVGEKVDRSVEQVMKELRGVRRRGEKQGKRKKSGRGGGTNDARRERE